MKYIVVESRIGSLTIETPIIFPERIVHDCVAQVIFPAIPGSDHKIIAAGDVYLQVMKCSGYSTSIKPNVESRGRTDAVLIQSVDYGVGIKARGLSSSR